jgi:uncharacterized protein YjbI with pentapeptide repeats
MTRSRTRKAARTIAAICIAAGAAAQPASAQDSPSRALDRVGEALMRDGQYEEAQATFAKALALEPNNGRAILLSAQVRWLSGGAQGAFPPVDLAGKPLERQDFSRIALSGLTIANAHGPRSDWSLARLEGVSLMGAQLFEADFSRAQFLRVNLDSAVLDRAVLRDANFASSTLLRASAPELAAERASFAGVRATGADFSRSDFTSADLSSADLRSARFDGAVFTGARLANADLRGADLARSDLTDAILKGARVDCATRLPRGFDPDKAMVIPLDLCGGAYALDFRGKDLAGMSFRDLDMRGALFAGARMGGADFNGANLDGADFEGASGFDASFAPASARESYFDNVAGPLRTLGRSDLRNARLSGPANSALEITIGPSGPRTEGAHIRNARITLDHRAAPPDGATEGLGFAGLLFARIESSVIECAEAPATRGRRDQAAVAEWTAFAEAIDTARRAAAANPGVTAAESCRRSAQLYLSSNCEAGHRAAGVRYACPSRR